MEVLNDKLLVTLTLGDLESVIERTVKQCLDTHKPLQSDLKPVVDIKYVNRKQAAKILSIGLTKLNEMCKSGELISYRIGNGSSIRFIESEVREVLTRVKTGK